MSVVMYQSQQHGRRGQTGRQSEIQRSCFADGKISNGNRTEWSTIQLVTFSWLEKLMGSTCFSPCKGQDRLEWIVSSQMVC